MKHSKYFAPKEFQKCNPSCTIDQMDQRFLDTLDALRAQADEMFGKLDGMILVIPMRVGDNDKLYGSVTSHIIGDALAEKGLEVDRRRILFDHAIRTLGEHPVRIRLHADVVAALTVNVVSEDKYHGEEEAAPAQEAEAAAEAPAEAPNA